MNLDAIQAALAAAGIDGWLFCDFHHRDPMAYRILGLDPQSLTTRRWYYYIPAAGEPVKLTSLVEARKLEPLPGRQEHYRAWGELHDRLREMVGGVSRLAMQYSPMNDIPYVSVVDAGTVELVRSFGPEVVSSADLVQEFESLADDEGVRSHFETGEIVQSIKDEAFARLDEALRAGREINEYEVAHFIISRFEQEGLTRDEAIPIVGFNEHAADPHFEPTAEGAHTLALGDTILIDLWARRVDPPGVYYDITWCGFAGQDPPQEYLKIFGIACEARDAALQFVRDRFAAGQDCYGHEVDEACREVIERAGYGEAFLHRTGHGIGTDVHGNGVNIDNLETRDTRKLMPGCCFSIEPGIYLAGRMGVRTEIDVFVTPSGEVVVAGPIQKELILVG